MGNQPAALILAAGQGKRMHSSLPKVLHPCVELPLVCHVVRLALASGCKPVVVVVSPATRAAVQQSLTAHFPDASLVFAVQEKPQGTGDAARAGLDAIAQFAGQVFILYGDVPLLTAKTLQALQAAAKSVPLAFLSAMVGDPTGYGRVVRDARGQASGVVEHRDCTPEQLAIKEINAGVYVGEAALLREGVRMLRPGNAQNEYYLTDVVALAASRGGAVSMPVEDVDEVRGVNSRAELADAEAIFRRRLVAGHQARGVSFRDPTGTFLGVDVEIGQDVEIGVGVQLWGTTRLAEGVRIDGPTVIRDSVIGPRSHVHAFSHLEQATLEAEVSVGPYARLRPAAHLEDGARVGNFVEVKKSRLGKGAKANHLAYVGDADVGPGSNLGAGTITCNYDGFNKSRTEIGANVFVGSNSTLVAPLQIEAGAFVAAGSVITKQVPSDALAFGRAQQSNREGYATKLRDRLKALKKGKKEER